MTECRRPYQRCKRLCGYILPEACRVSQLFISSSKFIEEEGPWLITAPKQSLEKKLFKNFILNKTSENETKFRQYNNSPKS